jgi:UDP-GlcNAc:undecaprenyl-phosphate/decaprenyl-phosphate GlcNAc-1-phosphate transferase
MFSQLLPIFVASLTTLVMIQLLRPFALRINLLDTPSDRKLHSGSVPLIGGISMFFGMVISILVLPTDLNEFNYFLLASLILVIIGVLDDHQNISVSLRIVFQVLVAVIIISGGGISILSFGNLLGYGEILLNGWAYFISVIAIIVAINAVNMTDGVHGLAAGNSLVTFVAILLLSAGNMSHQDLWIPLLFCSVLPVFLIHNLCLGVSKSKRIFMGDAGSMFIGMGIVWLLLDLSQGEVQIFNPVTALWLFAVPLIDMVSIFIRRLVSGQSPFNPDLFHIHHILMRLGFKERNVLLLLLLFSILMAVVGILGERYEVAEWAMFSGFLMIFVIYMFCCGVAVRKIILN